MPTDKTENIFCIFTAIVALFTSWTIYYSLPFKHVFEVVLFLLIMTKYHVFSQKSLTLYILFVCLSLWYYMPSSFDIGMICTGLYKTFIFGSLFFLKPKHLIKILNYFSFMLACIIAFGIIAHILRITGIYDFPMITMVNSDNRSFEVYLLHVYQHDSSMRFASIFDEPGYLGTLCAFILALEEFNLKKWYNIIFLVGGILSLSFAFYVLTAIILIFYLVKTKNAKIAIAIVFIIGMIYTHIPHFFDIILERDELSIISGGNYTDNRGSMEKSLAFIDSRPILNRLVGSGYDMPIKLFHDNTTGLASSNIYRLILQMGYIGVFLLCLFIIVNTKKKFPNILFAIIFIASLYQRPHIFETIFIMLLAYSFKVPLNNDYSVGNKRNILNNSY